jgi:phosphatidylglycerophosphatase A
MKKLYILLGTVGGVGYIPFLPGTLGTMVGVAIYVLFSRFFPQTISYIIMLAVFLVGGIWVSSRCNQYFEGDDNSSIVIDELVGFLITMLFVPFSFRFLLLGFVLFRVIDITKPFKIGKIEKISGGWGIMGDDIAAGVLANLIIQALRTMLGW